MGRVRHALGPPLDAWLGLDVTMAQLKVLLVLHHRGPTSVSTLAQVLSVRVPTVTGVLDRLVEEGLVCREENPEDRRSVLASLTPAGRSVVERVQAASRARLVDALQRLSAEQLHGLASALAALLATAEERRS